MKSCLIQRVNSVIRKLLILLFLAVGVILATPNHVLAEWHLPSSGGPVEGFNRPLITITFDDGIESAITESVPVLKEYGFPATFFVYTAALNTSGHFSDDEVIALKNAGHEIGSHSVNHPHLKTLTYREVDNELAKSKQILEELIKAPVNNFAAPYGEVSPEIVEQIKKYYKSNRSVIIGYNSKSQFDPYSIMVQNLEGRVPLYVFEEWLDKVIKDKTWMVLTYHGADLNSVLESVTPIGFKQQIEAIKKRNLAVVTIEQALQEILPQLEKKKGQ